MFWSQEILQKSQNSARDIEYNDTFNKYINDDIFILKFIPKLLKYMIRDL